MKHHIANLLLNAADFPMFLLPGKMKNKIAFQRWNILFFRSGWYYKPCLQPDIYSVWTVAGCCCGLKGTMFYFLFFSALYSCNILCAAAFLYTCTHTHYFPSSSFTGREQQTRRRAKNKRERDSLVHSLTLQQPTAFVSEQKKTHGEMRKCSQCAVVISCD